MWQDNFTEALCVPNLPPPSEVMRWDGMRDSKRFDVYRNNVFVSLTEAMQEGFPLARKLVGEKFFRALARAYCAQYLPTSPVLLWYGADFGDFLDGFPPAAQVPYLADIVRLEYAERQSTHAADAPWHSIEAISPDILLNTRLILHPSVYWVASNYPLYDIWYRTQYYPAHPISSDTAQDVLIYRPEYQPIPILLSQGGVVFFEALAAGQTFAEAADITLERAAGANLETLIPLALRLATIRENPV